MSAPLSATHSVEEVAAALGETESFVQTKCRRREWPHLRGARGRVSFTAEQYAEILRLIAYQPPAERDTGRISFAPRSGRRAS
jgi:hypothetical protein